MSRFDYIKYDEEAVKTQKGFKGVFEAIEVCLGHLPEGRAKSLALTKLEESYMWVGKAIRDDQLIRNPSAEEQPERCNS